MKQLLRGSSLLRVLLVVICVAADGRAALPQAPFIAPISHPEHFLSESLSIPGGTSWAPLISNVRKQLTRLRQTLSPGANDEALDRRYHFFTGGAWFTFPWWKRHGAPFETLTAAGFIPALVAVVSLGTVRALNSVFIPWLFGAAFWLPHGIRAVKEKNWKLLFSVDVVLLTLMHAMAGLVVEYFGDGSNYSRFAIAMVALLHHTWNRVHFFGIDSKELLGGYLPWDKKFVQGQKHLSGIISIISLARKLPMRIIPALFGLVGWFGWLISLDINNQVRTLTILDPDLPKPHEIEVTISQPGFMKITVEVTGVSKTQPGVRSKPPGVSKIETPPLVFAQSGVTSLKISAASWYRDDSSIETRIQIQFLPLLGGTHALKDAHVLPEPKPNASPAPPSPSLQIAA